MGLATLNVWIHDQQDPCRISDLPWRVFVTYCNGNPVEWCGHTYSIEEAKCGHAEFQLPPGCYFVGDITALNGSSRASPQFSSLSSPPSVPSLLSAASRLRASLRNHLLALALWRQEGGAVSCGNRKAPAGQSRTVGGCDEDLLKDVPQTAVDAAHERLVEHLTEFF